MPIILLLATVDVLVGQSSSTSGTKFENQYLTITIRSGWAVEKPADPTFTLRHGKYLLSINPMFTHASGITCGRFPEIIGGVPSVEAVMSNVDQPAGGIECAVATSQGLFVSKDISLGNLYSDSSKSRNGCTFPTNGHSVWFGALFCGQGSESEYTITLGYDSGKVDNLPRANSPELKQIFTDVVAMLKTLVLKPPILISSISPDSAPAGATVAVYGSGFSVSGYTTAVEFEGFTDNPMPAPFVAPDGNSLTFQVPTSINMISCPPGLVEVKGWCVPVPANHSSANDCPAKEGGGTNFCGVPIPPASYRIAIALESSGISSNSVAFTVADERSSPVSISLLYPNALVSRGDLITVHGDGFTASGNTVQIGSAVVPDLPSGDGKTIVFKAPAPTGATFIHGIGVYKASVSNANGQSNSISFGYR